MLEEEFEGDTDINILPAFHLCAGPGGPGQGHVIRLHQINPKVDTQSQPVPWSVWRQLVIAARESQPAFAALASTTWGTWWTQEIVGRNLEEAARLAVQKYLPLGVPVP